MSQANGPSRRRCTVELRDAAAQPATRKAASPPARPPANLIAATSLTVAIAAHSTRTRPGDEAMERNDYTAAYTAASPLHRYYDPLIPRHALLTAEPLFPLSRLLRAALTTSLA